MTFKTRKPLGRQFYFLLSILVLLTIFLRIGSVSTEWAHGIPDWHPDAGRYFAQERSYIDGNYKPVGSNSLYTGNPYANILLMSWIWRAANRVALYAGLKTLPKDSFFLSKLERIFYVVLSLFLVVILFVFAGSLFDSWYVGFWTAFFFAVSPLAIGLIHTIKPEIPLTFFVTLAACLAYLATERGNFLFYALFGVFAGLATATKYNGVVVLLYLLILHFWGVSEKSGISKKRIFIRGLFSFRLWAAFLLWALTFYATEPILWLSLKRGLRYIYGYSRIARFVGMPGDLYGHPLKIFVYNIKQLPSNFILLVNCVDTFFSILAILPLIFTKGQTREKAFKIALFPTILILSLFLSKSLFGEEYLLHPLPFIYILSGLGWYLIVKFVLKDKRGKIRKKSLVCVLSLPLIVYGLYIGFREVRYFSFGNIRYYAKKWADSNLKGICIQTMKYAIPPTLGACKKGHHPLIIVVPSEKTYKRKIYLPPQILKLKTIEIEKNKPLLHHLRGHHITFYGKLGESFKDFPVVPSFPVPHIHEGETTITRFLNGIDFNPGYNTFSLSPLKSYTFRMISRQPLQKFFLILENTNTYNKIEISNIGHPLFLLPFEKKVLPVKLLASFPWTSPYVYRFKIRSEGDLLVKYRFVKKGKPLSTNSHKGFLKAYVLRKMGRNHVSWPPFDTKEFSYVYKEIYRYNFDLLKNMLGINVPVGYVDRVETTTDFYRRKHPGDFCLFCKEPVLLESGIYLSAIDVYLCMKGSGKVVIKVITPSKVLKKVTLTPEDVRGLSSTKACSYVYRINLPFRVESLSMIHLVTEVEGDCAVEIRRICYKTDFQRCFLEAFQRESVDIILHRKKGDYTDFLAKKISPKIFSFEKSFEVANYLLEKGANRAALSWFESCLRKNPLCKVCLEKMIQICVKEGALQKELQYRGVLSNRFSTLTVGPWCFEAGTVLKAVDIQKVVDKGKKLHVKLFCKLPNISGDQAAQILLKHGETVFGTCVSFLSSTRMGEFYKIEADISIPEEILSGTYQVIVRFLLPKYDYKYKRTERKPERVEEAIIGKILVN